MMQFHASVLLNHLSPVLHDIALGYIPARRSPRCSLEVARKVTLVEETGLNGGVRDRISLPKQFSRSGNTKLGLVLMWWNAHFAGKNTEQMKAAKLRDRRKLQ